jgi:NTF2-related export protein 1/2
VVDVACRAADKFVSTYYKSLDSQRHILEKLYGIQSILLWNGNPYSGSSQIAHFMMSLPTSEHEILGYDSQPILTQPNQMDLLVSVHGAVKFPDSKRHFNQVFVLTKQESSCN